MKELEAAHTKNAGDRTNKQQIHTTSIGHTKQQRARILEWLNRRLAIKCS